MEPFAGFICLAQMRRGYGENRKEGGRAEPLLCGATTSQAWWPCQESGRAVPIPMSSCHPLQVAKGKALQCAGVSCVPEGSTPFSYSKRDWQLAAGVIATWN